MANNDYTSWYSYPPKVNEAFILRNNRNVTRFLILNSICLKKDFDYKITGTFFVQSAAYERTQSFASIEELIKFLKHFEELGDTVIKSTRKAIKALYV